MKAEYAKVSHCLVRELYHVKYLPSIRPLFDKIRQHDSSATELRRGDVKGTKLCQMGLLVPLLTRGVSGIS